MKVNHYSIGLLAAVDGTRSTAFQPLPDVHARRILADLPPALRDDLDAGRDVRSPACAAVTYRLERPRQASLPL